MIRFSDIAEKYLLELGLIPDYCDNENEAREKSLRWKIGNPSYPVYFFNSETSGEKQFEEFYSKNDSVDLGNFKSLGIIKNSENPSKESVKELIQSFEVLFKSDRVNKNKIIVLLNKYLSDFNHIETGKNLDNKL